jgi:hypothetical protein
MQQRRRPAVQSLQAYPLPSILVQTVTWFETEPLTSILALIETQQQTHDSTNEEK